MSRRWCSVVGLVAVVAGCHRAVQITPSPKIPTGSRWTATLASPQTLAGAIQIRGSSWMAAPSMNDSAHTLATIQISNAESGGVHPWAVHMGSCGNDQGVFGSNNTYKALHVGSDGTASSSATLNEPAPKTGNYFVEVLASPTNTNTVIACGNMASPSA